MLYPAPWCAHQGGKIIRLPSPLQTLTDNISSPLSTQKHHLLLAPYNILKYAKLEYNVLKYIGFGLNDRVSMIYIPETCADQDSRLS